MMVYRCETYPDGTQVLALAPEIECWTDLHYGMLGFATVYLVVVIIGTPCFIAYLILHHQAKVGVAL